jgi:hypothetical protein
MTLTPAHARGFADAWYAAWNAHDLDAIMACYDPAIEHSSPFIKRYNDAIGRGDEPSIKGVPDLRGYFERALARNPTLRFEPQHLATGLESVILVYRRHSHDTPPGGELSAEVFFLKAAGGTVRVVRSVSHYG